MYRVLIAAAFWLIAVTASAQSDTDLLSGEPLHPQNGHVYFRGRPLPECRSFWLLEERFEFRMNDVSALHDPAPMNLALDLGHMFNINPHSAFGGSFYFGINEDRWVQGARLRYRHWITNHATIDISPGIIFHGGDQHLNQPKTKYPGLIISTELGLKDLIAFNLTMEHYALNNVNLYGNHGTTDTRYYAGFTLGSYSALAGIAATAITGFFATLMAREIEVL